jgi:hypothetical protein
MWGSVFLGFILKKRAFFLITYEPVAVQGKFFLVRIQAMIYTFWIILVFARYTF